jgi:hypothetical protein
VFDGLAIYLSCLFVGFNEREDYFTISCMSVCGVRTPAGGAHRMQMCLASLGPYSRLAI